MADDRREPFIRVSRIGGSISWFSTEEKPRRRPHPFPNLGTGGAIVAALITSSIGAQFVSNATVLLLYGWHAFFHDHLRIADWPRGRNGAPMLSNGTPLHWAGTTIIILTTIPVWAALMLGVEFAAGRVRAFLGPRWLWVRVIARLIGGVALIALPLLLNSPRGLWHPVPLAALIGGLVLIYKTLVLVAQNVRSSR
jgi:hypothetical protein